jgi:fucose 4-O-acetylase-like acetyltransferase
MIYSFHMPFFLYLSGLAAALSGLLTCRRNAWGLAAARRAQRLLLPFFAVSIFIVIAKLALARIMMVDNAPADLVSGLIGLFWDTARSPALSLWYLPVLFIVSLGCMVLGADKPERMPAFFAGALLLSLAPVPAVMYLDRAAHYAVFFVAGAWAGLCGGRWERTIDRLWPPMFALFLAWLIAIGVFGGDWPMGATTLAVGLIALPALHGWLRSFSVPSPALLLLGRYSFMVYLFNTMFIGLAKGVLSLVWSWDGAGFLPFAAAMMCAGLLGPLSLKRVVLRKMPVLDRLTD